MKIELNYSYLNFFTSYPTSGHPIGFLDLVGAAALQVAAPVLCAAPAPIQQVMHHVQNRARIDHCLEEE